MSRVLDLWAGMTGVVQDFAGTTAPEGWLMCFGQAVSRTEYANLFAVIGTTYGAGNGSTTFNLPDVRGRVCAGVDNMGGTAAGRLTTAGGGVNGAAPGAVGGAQTHTLTQAQLPAVAPTFTGEPLAAHGHPVRIVTEGDSTSNLTGGVMLGSNQTRTNYVAFTGTPADAAGQQVGGESAGTPSGTISNLGSGAAHPNVQPTIVLNKIIKT